MQYCLQVMFRKIQINYLLINVKFYEVPLIKVKENKQELGAIIGKSDRSVVSILDFGFAEAMINIQGE